MQPHRIISSLFALAFLILVSSFDSVFRFLFAAMLVYGISLGVYNYWYLKRHNFFTIWSWLRPLFFLAATIGIYLAIPQNIFSVLFLLAASGFQFLVQYSLISASEQKIFYETLYTMFGFLLSLFAARFFIFPLQSEIVGIPSNSFLLIVIFMSTFFVVRSSFDYIPVTNQKKLFFAWLLSLLMLEVAWAIAYLPLTYTALTIIVFNIFYGLWIVSYYHLYHNISPKKITFHFLFALFLILMTFLTTPWRIAS